MAEESPTMRVEEFLSGSVTISDGQKIFQTKKVLSSNKAQLKNELTLAKLALESAKMAAAALEERLAKEGEAGDGEQKNDDDDEDSVDDVLLISEDELEAGTTAPASLRQPLRRHCAAPILLAPIHLRQHA